MESDIMEHTSERPRTSRFDGNKEDSSPAQVHGQHRGLSSPDTAHVLLHQTLRNLKAEQLLENQQETVEFLRRRTSEAERSAAIRERGLAYVEEDMSYGSVRDAELWRAEHKLAEARDGWATFSEALGDGQRKLRVGEQRLVRWKDETKRDIERYLASLDREKKIRFDDGANDAELYDDLFTAAATTLSESAAHCKKVSPLLSKRPMSGAASTVRPAYAARKDFSLDAWKQETPTPSFYGIKEHDDAYTMELARQDATRYRKNAVNGWCRAVDAWEYWRNNDRQIKHDHEQGIPPEAPDWKLGCSRTEFDVQHLREARRLVGEISREEDNIYDMMRIARDAGARPLDWQRADFPTHPDDGYRMSQEEAVMASAPVDRIRDWRDSLPAAYGEDSGFEDPAEELPERDELEPGDSASCVTDRITRGRMMRYRSTLTK